MRRLFLFAALFALAVAPLHATVVDSLGAPNDTWGLTWDGTHLWAGQDDDPVGIPQLLELDPVDGSVLNQYPIPGEELRGLAWDGTSIWVYSWRFGSTNVDQIYQVDPSDGTILDSLATPFSSNNYVGGMTWMNGFLYLTRYYPDNPTEIHKVDPATGASVATITSPHPQPNGITTDGSSLWMVGDYFNGAECTLYQLDPDDGTVLHEEHPLGPDVVTTRPYGLTYDGTYFWMITKRGTSATERDMYVLDVSGEDRPSMDIPTEPVDFGGVFVDDVSPMTLMVRNVGAAELTATFSTEAPFSVEPANLTLAAGDDATVTVTFAPTEIGVAEGALSITSNDPIRSAFQIDLSGEGLSNAPQVGFTPETLTFVLDGTSFEVTPVEMSNTGAVDVAAAAIEFTLADSTFEGINGDPIDLTFPATLAPGEAGDVDFGVSMGVAMWLFSLGQETVSGQVVFTLDAEGSETATLPISGTIVNAVADNGSQPLDFALATPYPNPFNAGTVVRYTLPQASPVKLHVVDLLGREVTSLVNRTASAGVHEAFWNGRAANGAPVASGLYFIRMEAGDFLAVQRVQFVK